MMTSEIDVLKTNEFLRRRKLRLQQVREQSKDIAKKIRQRAKIEQLKQVVDLDVKKQKEYLDRQGELVKKLEDLYAKGVTNIGASHKNAVGSNIEELTETVDLSKLRGREAAAELKRKKQEKLDEQKKLLDRKLQAREAANQISREKSASVANKLSKKDTDETQIKLTSNPEHKSTKYTKIVNNNNDKPIANDMATQWDFEEIPNEWEPNIPTLLLPKDDKDCLKETNNNIENKSDRNKRLDLFALSEEMPSSLRGGLINIEDHVPIKPSLTLVSNYLQNRGMRLRETDTISKCQTDDLQSIKQTILHTRSSKPEGSLNACHVLDEQIIPVPSWHAEKYCEFCSHSVSHHKKTKDVYNSQLTKSFRFTRPSLNLPSPILKETSHLKKNNVFSAKSNAEKLTKSTGLDSGLTRKSSVLIYNHSTRDTRNLPTSNENLVVQDNLNQEDAYSQAVKESAADKCKDREHQNIIQDMRNKVAMTKQSVEKEYIDTITFLNSLPKDKDRPIHNAYKDENRQQVQRENRQRKLQQGYRQIEKECKKHSCTKNRHKSKTPAKSLEDDIDRDFQYSWMPVPESDDNLAIHTIPMTIKEGKTNNTVKFSKVDSYHEYRSRHKHTPPTKDNIGREKQTDRKIEAVIIDNDSANSTDHLSLASESSSVENVSVKKIATKTSIKDLSDAERIIIYKIIDSKNKKKNKKARLIKDVTKSPSSVNKTHITNHESETAQFEQLPEGLYKTVSEKGDNITSMYFSHNQQNSENIVITPEEIKHGRPCSCNKVLSQDQQKEQGLDTNIQWENGEPTSRTVNTCVGCQCGCVGPTKHKANVKPSVVQPSAATSTSSFKTATNDKANNALPDGGYVKLLDNGGEEAGKFYIGASGFLKDDAYEVIIQLRKKDGSDKAVDKELNKQEYKEKDVTNKVSQPVSIQATELIEHSAKSREELKEATTQSTNEIKCTSKTSIKTNSTILLQKESSTNIDSYNLSEKVNANIQQQETESGEKDMILPKNLVDKEAFTSIQESHALLNSVPKTDLPPKQATSIYTQTSNNSPNSHPVYFHMSSSTSTAYMSPPEYVLPKFLRRDYHNVEDELYDCMQDFVIQDKIEISDHHYSEEYEGCKCIRCVHAKNIVLSKTKAPICCKKHAKNRLRKMDTPPNTARTCSTENGNDDFYHKRKSKSRDKCKVLSKPESLISSKQQMKNKMTLQHCYKLRDHITSTLQNRLKSSNGKSASKPNLNPDIKEYINKLLTLNKEGMQVVEVAEQECSSIATPSSSIINYSKNIDKMKPVESNISLEQIKSILKLHILEEYIKKKQEISDCSVQTSKNQFAKNLKNPRVARKKQVHKVKSLNISKNILKTNTSICDAKQFGHNIASSTTSTKENESKPATSIENKTKFRSKSSPTPRQIETIYYKRKLDTSNVHRFENIKDKINVSKSKSSNDRVTKHGDIFRIPNNRASITRFSSTSTESENNIILKREETKTDIATTMSTQTVQNNNKEMNYVKLAEDKLQNMEKIADLTEKCTKRLSNLARVLNEVRKNKSLAYSQVSTSDTASDSDHKSDKNISNIKYSKQVNDFILDTNKIPEIKSPIPIPVIENSNDINRSPDSTNFIPFLSNIPKPNIFKTNDYNQESDILTSEDLNNLTPVMNVDNCVIKTRPKPPPALSRIHLKNGQEHVIPHELSTVLEVDSPMSIKLKTTSSRETKDDESGSNTSSAKTNRKSNYTRKYIDDDNGSHGNPDLLQSNLDSRQSKISLTESSEDSKLQMMDLKQFNEIMLKPFISFKEHAKRCNIVINEGSNLEDNPKDIATDDISSMHSDKSLPDIIGELLKRNVITEPFKYDTASNVNSTTVSSESTLSVLALSKVRKKVFNNKQSIEETSDSLSVSSNPDLENAFKKLGIGWASSTLKKTKERLALSSSSNTSSTSISQYKLKDFNNQDIPALGTDSVSTILNLTKKPYIESNLNDNKNAEQQTSLTNSMTVKEFLTNALAHKITFTNNSHRNDTEDEFVSLFETKMPENMKEISQVTREECSGESGRSASNNRARTSTPVQVFKSMTYHTSSSSNLSNGLFSNADDLSSVKVTSNSVIKHSTSDKDDLTLPNFSLKLKKSLSDSSKS